MESIRVDGGLRAAGRTPPGTKSDPGISPRVEGAKRPTQRGTRRPKSPQRHVDVEGQSQRDSRPGSRDECHVKHVDRVLAELAARGSARPAGLAAGSRESGAGLLGDGGPANSPPAIGAAATADVLAGRRSGAHKAVEAAHRTVREPGRVALRRSTEEPAHHLPRLPAAHIPGRPDLVRSHESRRTAGAHPRMGGQRSGSGERSEDATDRTGQDHASSATTRSPRHAFPLPGLTRFSCAGADPAVLRPGRVAGPCG